MAKLLHSFGKLPKKFNYIKFRLEKRGFLSIFSFGLQDRIKRYEMMYRRDCVVILPADFEKRVVYMIQQPRFIRALTETNTGTNALNDSALNNIEADFSIDSEDILNFEFPAGIIDEGETAEQSALRELAEETGITITDSTAISQIAEYYPSIGGSSEKLTAFVVNLEKTKPIFNNPHGDENEIIRVWEISFDDIYKMAKDGQIKTASGHILVRELMLRDTKQGG